MKVTHATSAKAKTPTLLLLTTENLEASQAALPAEYSELKLTKEHAAAEAWNSFKAVNGAELWLAGLGKSLELDAEKLRKQVTKAIHAANGASCTELQIVMLGLAEHPDAALMAAALGETPTLANYQFLAYRKEKKKMANSLKTTTVVTDAPKAKKIVANAASIAEATCAARDLINEPPNVLTAVELGKRASKLGKKYGFEVEVFDKKRITAEKMGGLLAVNRGSQLPPSFTIMTYTPKKPKNKKPIVLVGKGVVFDTGGLSLKPTAGSMDSMKSDMSGSAAVIGAMVALATTKSDLHVIALAPATDNRPGENAYMPQDVITMHDGSTVEVMNTDAEGRMLLADALSWAKQYEPELVIDLATLTGSAVIAVGERAIAMMSTADEATKQAMKEASMRVHERVVELPLWADYKEQLKSHVADLKNVGGRPAGSITAGKFLEHFTAGAYPWIHLDIAGPAFLNSADSYRPKEGTGVGVRLLLEFLATR